MVVDRAREYTIPHTIFRPMQFAYFCTTGLKEPIFSEHHLALCDEFTLLLLRNEGVFIPILLHRVEKEKFYVSFEVKKSFRFNHSGVHNNIIGEYDKTKLTSPMLKMIV